MLHLRWWYKQRWRKCRLPIALVATTSSLDIPRSCCIASAAAVSTSAAATGHVTAVWGRRSLHRPAAHDSLGRCYVH